MVLVRDDGSQSTESKALVFGSRLGEIGSQYIDHLQLTGQWASGLWGLGFGLSVFGLTARFVDAKEMAATEFAAIMGLAAVVFLVGGIVWTATVKYGESVLTTQAGYSTYIGRKADIRTYPAITGVFPLILRAGETITITGTGLAGDPAKPPPPTGLIDPQVAIDGMLAAEVTNAAGRLTAVVPQNLVPAGVTTPIPGTIQVLSAYGFVTSVFDVQLALQPSLH